MKKTLPIFTLLAFLMLLSAGNASGQYYQIQEGFSVSSLPAGWSSSNISVGNWSKIPNIVFPDQDYGLKLNVDGDNLSSWVQFPLASDPTDLSYSIKWRDDGGNLDMKIQTSTDSETWTDLTASFTGLDKSDVDNFQQVSIPINITGDVYIRIFAFTSDGLGHEDAGVYVDDIQLGKPTPPSDDASLTEIMVGGYPLFGFDPTVTQYTMDVIPGRDTTVTVKANHLDAIVTLTQAANLNGTEAERTATIAVKSADESVTTTTTIIFTLDTKEYHFIESFEDKVDPEGWVLSNVSYSNSSSNAANQVIPSEAYCAKMKTDALESSIQFPLVSGTESLSFWCKIKNPVFNPVVKIQSSADAITWTDEETTIPGLDLTDSINFQDIYIPLSISSPVYIRIHVSADGGDSGTGMLCVDDIRLEKPALTDDDASLAAIYIGGKLMNDFHPTTTTYAVDGVMPDDDITVSADANHENASVSITQATNLEGTEAERTATIVVTSADQSQTFTATILFTASQIKYHFREGFSDDELPAGWSSSNIAMGNWSSIPNLVFTDQEYGAKMKTEDPVDSWMQFPTLVGAGDLSFSAYVKNPDGNLAVKFQSSTNGTDWTDVTATINGLDLSNTSDNQSATVSLNIDGLTYIRIYVYTTDGASSKGALYVDDLQLVKSAPATNDAYLSSIVIDSIPMRDFDLLKTSYDTIVSLAESFGPVSAIANNPKSTVTVTQVSNITGSETERTATIVVESEDKTASSTVTIIFEQADYLYKTGFFANEGLEGWSRHRVFQDQTPNFTSSNKYQGEGNIKFTGGHETSEGSDGIDATRGHLVSPYLENVGTFSFSYYAEAKYPEQELNVYLKYNDTDSTLAWSKKGNELDPELGWQWGEVVIEEDPDTVQICVYAVCDINNESDSRLWMDDFTVTYYVKPAVAADDASLDGIYMGGNLIEGFDPDVTSYALEVSPIQDVTLTAEALSDLATVTIDQALNATGTAEQRTATITVKSEDESVTAVTTVVFSVPGGSAIDDAVAPKVVFYPNPATDMVNVQVPGNAYQKLEIFNIAGQKVRTARLNKDQEAINIASLREGIYLMQFTGEAGTHVAKLIKK